MRRALPGLAALLVLAACESTPPSPVNTPPPRMSTAPRVTYPPQNTDACGARPLQYLVGRPRTEIPVPLQPSMRRVVCTTCPMTQDFAPLRQTILFDADSGLVREVRCG
jgi:hypothetical protein